MRHCLAFGIWCSCVCIAANQASAWPDETVRNAGLVLNEVMAIPARQIPEALFAEAQGIAIIPDVIKIGFVAGIRRGHGVVLVRDANGQWGLPQFVTLTGGSVGWQVGVQGTDVVLVFMTKKSVDGLLSGKFTIGADAAAAAGPVGRNAAAATDLRLKAEILSYSRSRGLFVGLSLDGSAIEIDGPAQTIYYGAQPGQPPRIPESALRLRQELVQLTPGLLVQPPAAIGTMSPAVGPTPAAVGPTPAVETKLSTLRKSLASNATRLDGIVDASWRKYLTLPREVFDENRLPSVESLQNAMVQYDRVVQDPRYKALAASPEFQATQQALRDFTSELSAVSTSELNLPPPPAR